MNLKKLSRSAFLYMHFFDFNPLIFLHLINGIKQGIINGFTKEDGLSHTQDNKEELRTDAEQNVAKFIEVAKQMETFFLQRRLQLSVLKPEQLIKEVKPLPIFRIVILNKLTG